MAASAIPSARPFGNRSSLATRAAALTNAATGAKQALIDARKQALGAERELLDLANAAIELQEATSKLAVLTLWALARRTSA